MAAVKIFRSYGNFTVPVTFCRYGNRMEIEFDPDKRDDCLEDRHLDFAKTGEIFERFHMSREDDRRDYGEVRVVTIGRMGRKIVVCVWTERAGRRRIISLREAEPDEREIYNLYRP